MTSVYLYGALGRKFGYRFRFEVASPAEAVRALVATRPGFQRYLIEHSTPGYHIFIGQDPLASVERIHDPVGRQAIKIVPAVVGGKSPWVGIVLGVVIIAAAVALGPMGWGVIGTYAAVTVGMVGATLVIGGVTQLLANSPKAPEVSESPENTPSALFSGPVNTTAQGHPVPIGYGRLRVGSAVISATITTVNV